MLIIGILVTSVVGVLITSWRQASRFSDDRLADFQTTADFIATIVAEPLALHDTNHVQFALASASRLPSVIFTRVVDSKGKLVAERGAVVVLTTDGYKPLALRSRVEIGADILWKGAKIGRLTLVTNNDSMLRQMIDNQIIAIVIALVAAAIGIFMTGRMQRRITAPLVHLADAMRKTRESQDFSHTVEIEADDETGQLVEAFNDLQRNIRLRDKKLSQHRQNLERIVEVRTLELVNALDEAEQASVAKSYFLATMSHEIRTPMNGMLVMAELLASSPLTPQNRRYADVIVKSGHALLTIINDILDLSKIESGKLELEELPLDPAAVIEDVLVLFYERAAGKGLDLAGYVAPDVPRRIVGDPVRLNQVLTNLVNNALKFTPAGSVFIELRALGQDRDDGKVRLEFSVSDTGIGIPENKQLSIFDAFSQADQSTTRQYGGTGLGLAICQRLVGAMGGVIKVASELGTGSRFTFVIEMPLAG